jgi:hypothetical protein
MKSLILVLAAFSAFNANAFEKSDLIGRWKMTDYKCASGKPVNMGGDIADIKLDIVLTFIDGRRADGKIDFSYKFKDSFIKETRQEYAKSLADAADLPQTPDNLKSIADIKKSLSEFNKMTQPNSCSNISRMSYYVRGNVIYTNTLNNFSTCTSLDSSDSDSTDIQLEASTIEIKGNQLIITEGREVSKDSACPVNDQSVMTLVRE